MRCCPGHADFGRAVSTMWPLPARDDSGHSWPWLLLALGPHMGPTVGSLPALVLVSWLHSALGWAPSAWPGEAAGKKGPAGSAREGPQLPHWHRAWQASREGASATAEPGAAQPSPGRHLLTGRKSRALHQAFGRSYLNPLFRRGVCKSS